MLIVYPGAGQRTSLEKIFVSNLSFFPFIQKMQTAVTVRKQVWHVLEDISRALLWDSLKKFLHI